METNRIVVAPWLELKEALRFGSVEFLPKNIALERWPVAAPCIDAVTSYFCDGYAFPYDEFKQAFLIGQSVPMRPVLTKPTIVNFASDKEAGTIEIAFDALAFASMAKANDSFEYSNATVFYHGVQKLDGSAFVAHRTRRRTGGQLNGFDPRCRIESKPSYCGKFVTPDDEFLRALEFSLFASCSNELREALGILGHATLDSDQVQPEIESSFYALVAERLLADRSRKADIRQRLDSARELLQPLVAGGGEHVVKALDVTNDRRNGVWHSGPRRVRPLEAYENHPFVPFSLVAFRAIEACIIAVLVKAGALDAHSDLAIKARVIDEWIGGISSDAAVPDDVIERNERARAAADILPRYGKAKLAAALERHLLESTGRTPR
jgi:hypothetical protein